jgi:hypothetical protein
VERNFALRRPRRRRPRRRRRYYLTFSVVQSKQSVKFPLFRIMTPLTCIDTAHSFGKHPTSSEHKICTIG